jgi:hypothetical protein
MTDERVSGTSSHRAFVTRLRPHIESMEQRNAEVRDRVIDYFERFEKFPPESILDDLIKVQFGHWQHAVRRHPGYKARDTLNTLVRIKSLLVKSVVEMHQHYDELQHERISQNLDDHEREHIANQVLKELVCFVSLESSLVAIARRHKSSRPDIESEIEIRLQRFYEPPVCHFVKCLRNNHLHMRLHPTYWEISMAFSPRRELNVRFFLNTAELLQTGDDWDESARAYLATGERLDPHEVASDCAQHAIELVNALVALNEEKPSLAVRHLNEVERLHDGWGARQMYGLVLQTVENRADFDPYPHLPKFFSESELRIIHSLPKNSRQQVDQMILLKDRWRICDDTFRKRVYKLFGVKDAI